MIGANERDDPTLTADATAFGGGFASLSDSELLHHFGGARSVRVPPRPAPTSENLCVADQVIAGVFDLVGESYPLGDRFSWKVNPSRDKEWQIAQHKFYFAVDLVQAYRSTGEVRYLKRWAGLLESWLDEMGTGFIAASDAQVEAKRVEHWVGSFLLLDGTDWALHVPGALLRRFLARIASEADYIGRNLRPARNHRTFQLYTIFLVGVVFPEFARSAELVELGRSKLTENLLTDFAADGVHVELSTHYHNITLETALAFVELAQLNGLPLEAQLLGRLHQAARYSLYFQWPDGDIPLINDSDNGDHRPMLAQAARLFDDPELLWGATLGNLGTPPGARSRHFDVSGYFVLNDTWGRGPEEFLLRQHVFYDCAQLGEGSHSHYDLFNLTWFAGGSPVVVDPGRYTYCADPDAQGIDWRREFKSTASHNTVCIDGRSQTRYLSKSKNPPPGVERYDRTRHAAKHGPSVEIADADFHLGERTDWICGTARSHEYFPLHFRLVAFMAREYLLIFDFVRIEDGAAHECVLRYHLAEHWLGRVKLREEGQCSLFTGPGWQVRVLGAEDNAIDRGWVSTDYGVKSPAPVICCGRTGTRSVAFCSVLSLDGQEGGAAITGVERVSTTDPDHHRFEVAGLAGGQAFADVFLMSTGPDAAIDEPGLRWCGKFIAYRRTGSGKIAHLCAARPRDMVLAGGDGPSFTDRGHVEWSAATWG